MSFGGNTPAQAYQPGQQQVGFNATGDNRGFGQRTPTTTNTNQDGASTLQGLAGTYQNQAEATANSGNQQIDRQTALNRPNTTNAYGSQQQWTTGPDGTPQLSQNFGGQMGQANQNYQQQMLQNSQTPLDNGSAARDQAITGAYNQATSRLNPQFQQAGNALNANLANQGLDSNSQAARTAQQQFGQQRNDAYGSAMNSAIAQGTAAQQATFGQNLAARQYPMQQLQGMQGFLQNPNYNPAAAGQGTNYLGSLEAYGNYDNGVASNSAAAAGSAGQAAGAILGAAVAASDERLKANVQRHPVEALPGVPVATFEYKAEPGVQHRGVIAQDMEAAGHGRYVHHAPDGTKAVDYSFSPFLFK